MFEIYADDYLKKTQRIPIGHQGEDKARCLVVNASEVFEEFGTGGVIEVAIRRSGDEVAYYAQPADVSAIGSYIKWTIRELDVEKPGTGYVQLTYKISGNVVKSWVYRLLVRASENYTGDPPEYYENLFEQIQEETRQSAQSAQSAAESAETAGAAAATAAQAAVAPLQAQLDAAISGVTVDSEVINIRAGYDGTLYTTAGAAVRGQVSDLWQGLGALGLAVVNGKLCAKFTQ